MGLEKNPTEIKDVLTNNCTVSQFVLYFVLFELNGIDPP